MSQLDIQVQELTEAVQQLIDQAIPVNNLNRLPDGTVIDNDDLFVFELKDDGGTFAITKEQLQNAFVSTPIFLDQIFRIQNSAITSKQIAFEASGISSNTTRTIKMPDFDVDLAGASGYSETGDIDLGTLIVKIGDEFAKHITVDQATGEQTLNMTAQEVEDAVSEQQLATKEWTKLFGLLGQAFNGHSDTDFPSPVNRQQLYWDAITGKWMVDRNLAAIGIIAFDYEVSLGLPLDPFPDGISAWDNVNPLLVTAIVTSDTDLAGVSQVETFSFAEFRIGDIITYYSFANRANFQSFLVTSNAVYTPPSLQLGVDAITTGGTGIVTGERTVLEWKNNNVDQVLGWGFYVHDQSTPSTQVITTTPSLLVIDGVGATSNNSYLPREIRGVSELWDTVNNKIVSINEGDGYSLRIDLGITSKTGSPEELILDLDISGLATPTTVIVERIIGTGKTPPYTVSVGFPYFTLSTFKANGGQIFLSTNTGTATLTNRQISIHRISGGLS